MLRISSKRTPRKCFSFPRYREIQSISLYIIIPQRFCVYPVYKGHIVIHELCGKNKYLRAIIMCRANFILTKTKQVSIIYFDKCLNENNK